MRSVAVVALVFFSLLSGVPAFAEIKEIELPQDVSKLRPSELPGYDLALQKCGICHSANYISYQPPGKDQVQWTREMTKMQHSYGAPLSERDINLIGAYLSVAYGSASATDDSIVSLTSPDIKAADSPVESKIDVQTLLNNNACLGCHAIDHDVVGPAFVKVAKKYSSSPQAQTTLAASIRSGGSGRWGAATMPAMTGLSEAEAKALATYVLNTIKE